MGKYGGLTGPESEYLVGKSLLSDPALQAQWASKKLVWVPHPVEGGRKDWGGERKDCGEEIVEGIVNRIVEGAVEGGRGIVEKIVEEGEEIVRGRGIVKGVVGRGEIVKRGEIVEGIVGGIVGRKGIVERGCGGGEGKRGGEESL